MITAVDTSVLLDALLNQEPYAAASVDALENASAMGKLVACPVVWAEVRAAVKEPQNFAALMAQVGIAFDPLDQESADVAGDFWRAYRRAGGTREHLIPDFLIGAHARVRASRLLARDRGFFRRHFTGLTVVEPAGPPQL